MPAVNWLLHRRAHGAPLAACHLIGFKRLDTGFFAHFGSWGYSCPDGQDYNIEGRRSQCDTA